MPKDKGKKRQKYWAVTKGRTLGVFGSWEDGAGPSVEGYPGYQIKVFHSKIDAEQWYQANDPSEPTTLLSLPRVVYTAPAPDGPDLIVYSDGACLRNGRKGAMAGIGVWWGPGDSAFGDPRNISERCPGEQTNNRAELISIVRILETTPISERTLRVRADSDYAISAITTWSKDWIRNGWVTTARTPVKNSGIIKYILAMVRVRRHQGQTFVVEKVKAHSNNQPNEAADALAKAGRFLPDAEDEDWESLTHTQEQILHGGG